MTVLLYHDFYCYYYYAQESWDYIGSSRMVFDMEKGNFPNDPWKVKNKSNYCAILLITAAWLAQLVERQSVVKGSSPRPGQENVLPL